MVELNGIDVTPAFAAQPDGSLLGLVEDLRAGVQGAPTGGVLDDLFLSKGYGVASSSLNVLNNDCSTIISAEAAMMVKEHFVGTYGAVRHTIGWGGSGGAIRQYDIANVMSHETRTPRTTWIDDGGS